MPARQPSIGEGAEETERRLREAQRLTDRLPILSSQLARQQLFRFLSRQTVIEQTMFQQ